MIAILGKNNDKGLGTLTRQYLKHLPIDKAFFVEDSRTNHDIDGVYIDNPDQVINHLDGITILIVLEMPVVNVFRRCKQFGIKTILKVNYEFLPESLQHEPDLYLCSSSLNYEAVHSSKKILIPDPIDLDDITVKPRKKCNTFVHNAGTIGLGGANGTKELIEALKLTSKPFKMIIRSQVPLECDDSRVELKIGSIDFKDLYTEGDVFIMPQKFRATSLPIQEAMASGMPVLSSNIQPFNEFVNFTFVVGAYTREYLTRPVNCAVLDPKEIAKSLDRLYDLDIEEESEIAIKFGESISWQKLRNKYLKLLK